VNPTRSIIVEGVSNCGPDVYWWGGNLSAVRTAPIHLTHPEKLVYSAHEYGPEVHDQTWFSDATFPANLAAVWTQHFDFIMQQGIGHLLLGEFGIKDRTADSKQVGAVVRHFASRPWARPTHGPSGAGIPTLATPKEFCRPTG